MVPIKPYRVSHDPTLVGSLRRDHQDLRRIYARIDTAREAGNFNEIRQLLVGFKSRFESHVLTENVRFYSYLEQLFEGDAENLGILHDFRREMNQIARDLIRFVNRYQASNFDAQRQSRFAHDYEAISARLAQRLDGEENDLYPLYPP